MKPGPRCERRGPRCREAFPSVPSRGRAAAPMGGDQRRAMMWQRPSWVSRSRLPEPTLARSLSRTHVRLTDLPVHLLRRRLSAGASLRDWRSDAVPWPRSLLAPRLRPRSQRDPPTRPRSLRDFAVRDVRGGVRSGRRPAEAAFLTGIHFGKSVEDACDRHSTVGAATRPDRGNFRNQNRCSAS